jgi:hypothetical protein
LRNRRPNSQLLWGLGCAAPALLGFGLWKVVPVMASFIVALTDWNVARSPRWVGVENFRRMLFHDPLFWKSLWVTSVYEAIGVPIAMTCAFALALLLNTGTPGQRIFRTLFYLPSIMPTIAVSVLWLWILNPDLGLLNALLDQIVPAEPSTRQPGSQETADADRRVAALERERDALAADVDGSNITAIRLARSRPNPRRHNRLFSPNEPISSLARQWLPCATTCPRVLIRYPRRKADARRQAESLAEALKKQGVEVADLRESDGAVGTSVSFFYARDAAVARRIGGLVGVAPARRPQMRDGLMARLGAIELSFSGDIH